MIGTLFPGYSYKSVPFSNFKYQSPRSRDKDDDEGSTPRAKSNEPREETPEVEAQRLPGLGKYDSDGSEEGEIEGGKEEKVERGEVRGEYHRDEEIREEGKRGKTFLGFLSFLIIFLVRPCQFSFSVSLFAPPDLLCLPTFNINC